MKCATILILCFLISYSESLFVGDRCILQGQNTTGTCLVFHDCVYAKQLLENNKTPQHCGFKKDVPVVCCPVSLVGIKTAEKCNQYHLSSNQVFAVSNGVQAQSKEFPHMAAVGFGEKTNILWLCGASLISNRFVLTAAHCVHSREAGPARWVRLGDLDLKNNTDDAKPADHGIEEAISHPDYKPPLHYHDIALLKLDEQISFGLFFRPACLHIKQQLPGSVFTVTGWGKTDFFGDPSSHLLKAQVSNIAHADCRKRFATVSGRKLPRGILDEYQICAGDAEGRDTCPGDSGGPLQVNMTETSTTVRGFIVVGITSFGKSCGLNNSAGVYTRVSAYIPWIESVVWP